MHDPSRHYDRPERRPLPHRARGWRRDFGPAGALALASVVFLAILVLQPPAEGRRAAVIFAPGTLLPDAAAALATVGARPVRHGAWENVVIADFGGVRDLDTLTVPGAWMLLDPVAVGGCFGFSPIPRGTTRAS